MGMDFVIAEEGLRILLYPLNSVELRPIQLVRDILLYIITIEVVSLDVFRVIVSSQQSM